MVAKGFFALLFLPLLSCGKAPSGDTHWLTLDLELPKVLTRSEGRWQRFLARAIRLEVVVRQGEPVNEKRFSFSPQQWHDLKMTGITLPDTSEEKIEIHCAIWDRNREGFERKEPVLKGQKSWPVGDIKERLSLDLHLVVPVAEYD